MKVRAVAELLQRQIGVDPLSLGENVLAKIVSRRMHHLGLTDPQRYAAHLQESAEELAALIEDVVVPETWFFRGGKVFDFLADHVRQTIRSAPPAATFRILSAPCSSGEEPYSMVMALTEAGIPRERWTVDGLDLSPRSLMKARQGIYRESAFRETPVLLRRKYFHNSDDTWEIDASLRGLVRFRVGNLLDPELLRGEGRFDLIFCRNVLIYLHAEARTRVLANLDRLLAPQGLLCMGHAEPLNLLDTRFQATGPHDFFLFERRQQPLRGRAVPDAATPVSPRKPPASSPPRRTRAPARPAARMIPVAAPLDPLVQARQEADAGALDRALQLCREHLAAAEPTAEAYSLLGVIHQARQERQPAIASFRRALYLDPQQEEALLHLLLLYQEDGNDAAALRLRERLERKTAGGET